MSKSQSGSNGAGNGSASTIKKPRYTRVQKRYIFAGIFGVIALLCLFITGDFMSAGAVGTLLFGSTKFSLLYASPDGARMSGRSGSVVYQRNGRRRIMTVPSLVQNTYTQLVRNRFGTNSNAWSGLSDADRATWNNAVGFTYVDRFGTSHVLKGKALYVRLNQNLANAGATLITTAPLPEDIAGLDSVVLTGTGGLTPALTLSFSPTPTLAGTQLMIFATPCLPAGYSRPSASKYRLIATSTGAVTSPALIISNWEAKYGTLVTGSKVFVKAVIINNTTGQASPSNIGSAVIS